jgi:hypothetical protein
MSRTILLQDLTDLELMTLRKRVTYHEALKDNDLYVLVQVAKEYIRREYGASGLWHLDDYTPADLKPSGDELESSQSRPG